ncbi:transposase [Streptomyces himalayensis]|uniref:transposase n=1 Tax=Streptomyces himalayensis TaxID=2820085 RepID=UPI0035E3F8AA
MPGAAPRSCAALATASRPRRGRSLSPPPRKVRTWLAEHADRIELHFLPAYASELNPDELVNAELKRSLPMHSRAHAPGPTRCGNPPVLPSSPNAIRTSSAVTSAARTSATSSNTIL